MTGSTSPFRSSSLPCSPFRKSANASASLRIAGTRPIRQQQAGRFLQAACTTANFLEKSSILNDLASMDIASDVEGLESAKQNLQIVQKRLMVREAFVYESFASRRLKEILKVPPAGPRWAWMLQGIETAEDTLPKQPGGRVASSEQASLQVVCGSLFGADFGARLP
ncbi:unnamed protein product [Effrenium voratum]|nr:unnamed protein product [Effrenium voratum]